MGNCQNCKLTPKTVERLHELMAPLQRELNIRIKETQAVIDEEETDPESPEWEETTASHDAINIDYLVDARAKLMQARKTQDPSKLKKLLSEVRTDLYNGATFEDDINEATKPLDDKLTEIGWWN